MDDRRHGASHGTELGLQAASLANLPFPSGSIRGTIWVMATRQRRIDPRRAALTHYRRRYVDLLSMAERYRTVHRYQDADSMTAPAVILACALRAERLDPEPDR